MSQQVTYEQMGWLRQLMEHGPCDVPDPECSALLSAGLITRGSRADGYDATAAGRRMAEAWVETTGDGPEQLKALFSNAFGPRR